MIDTLPLQVILLRLLALAGLTLIITVSWLVEPWRKSVGERFGSESWEYQLVRCPQCMGFWIGFAGWLLTALLPLPPAPEVPFLVVESALIGLVVSFLSTAVGGTADGA